jgi:hypothetical protein
MPNSHYSLQKDPTPDPASSNFKKVLQTVITICSRLLYPTGWAVQPSEDHGVFFKGKENLLGYNRAFISDEYERVNVKLFSEHLYCHLDFS